jgi:hypothetical protein
MGIPGHISIVLNEIADVSAKESIRKGEVAQYLIPGTPSKSYWKTKLRVAAKEWYRESGKQKGRQYFEYYYQNNGNTWFQRFKFRRKSIVLIKRRSGHCCIKQCIIRTNTVNTDMCECGEAKETINDILWQCKLFEEFRVRTIDDLMKRKIFLPYCIEAIPHCMLPKAVIPVALPTAAARVQTRVWSCGIL